MTASPPEMASVPRRRRIRRAQATDAGAIAALVESAEALRQISPVESFPLDRSTVLHWLLQRDAGYVLEDRGEIVAYGELVADKRNDARLWIGHMIVHPRRRGLGIGQRLVQELLHIAEHERGVREVAISAFADNPRALRCYQACGFERVDEERVEGRPLVGMRRRFVSRRRSPRTATVLLTGVLAIALSSILFWKPLRGVLEAAPWVWISVMAQPAAAALTYPLRRERRQSRRDRLRAGVVRATIANCAALVLATGMLLVSGDASQTIWAAGVYASATLIWVALLGGIIWIEGRV